MNGWLIRVAVLVLGLGITPAQTKLCVWCVQDFTTAHGERLDIQNLT
jgi:hypothetical protein